MNTLLFFKGLLAGLVFYLASVNLAMGFKDDRFVPSFPELVFTNWLKKVNASQIGSDVERRNTIIGKSYIRTYNTTSGERRIEIYKTSEGEIYDIGEHLDLGETADEYISTTTQIIASRIIWSILTADRPYIRSVIASNNIVVESNFLGSKEKQVFDYLNNVNEFGVDNFFFTVKDDISFLVLEVNKQVLQIKIIPTLDLLLQGQSLLLKEHLTYLLKHQKPGVSSSGYISPYYQLQEKQGQFSYALPDLEYYKNQRKFVINEKNNRWILSSYVPVTKTDTPITELIAHRWATLSLPTHLRYKDIRMSDKFFVEMIVEGYPADTLRLNGSDKIDLIGDLMGRGLPAYYNTISIKKVGEEVVVKGIWLVRDPELYYEHIFRVQDIFEMNKNQELEWSKSEIRALMAVRSDNVSNYRAQYPNKSNPNVLFRINMN
jgi:hypothetical protein